VNPQQIRKNDPIATAFSLGLMATNKNGGRNVQEKKPKNFQYAAEEEEKNVQVFPLGH
jgi:hypothetical protein